MSELLGMPSRGRSVGSQCKVGASEAERALCALVRCRFAGNGNRYWCLLTAVDGAKSRDKPHFAPCRAGERNQRMHQDRNNRDPDSCDGRAALSHVGAAWVCTEAVERGIVLAGLCQHFRFQRGRGLGESIRLPWGIAHRSAFAAHVQQMPTQVEWVTLRNTNFICFPKRV